MNYLFIHLSVKHFFSSFKSIASCCKLTLSLEGLVYGGGLFFSFMIAHDMQVGGTFGAQVGIVGFISV